MPPFTFANTPLAGAFPRSQSWYQFYLTIQRQDKGTFNLSEERPRVMWIVKIALSQPHTFIVLALVILILSPVAILKTPIDNIPNIEISVIAWPGPHWFSVSLSH
jgi:hypothetical protein